MADSSESPMRTGHFTTFADAWVRMAGSFIRGTTAANRAAMEAFDVVPQSNGDVGGDRTGSDVPPSIPSLAYEELDWQSERDDGASPEIEVGDTVTFSKRIDEEDVRQFARVSGDTNRLHLDEDFGEKTRFGGRIVHGTLVSGLISAALARFPGLTIYLSQDLEFRHPVPIGDRVRAHAEVIEDLGDNQYRLSTVIEDEDADTTIIDGEAVVIIDELPSEQ